ncbi:MAG: hypothetical protein QW367_02915 [Candidatus Aenigmatarchaeota archaeon]
MRMLKIIFVVALFTILFFSMFFIFTSSKNNEKVILKGKVVAIVTDFINNTSLTQYFLQTSDGKTFPIDISNATFNLTDFFPNYIGSNREVYVEGYWKNNILIVLNIFD